MNIFTIVLLVMLVNAIFFIAGYFLGQFNKKTKVFYDWRANPFAEKVGTIGIRTDQDKPIVSMIYTAIPTDAEADLLKIGYVPEPSKGPQIKIPIKAAKRLFRFERVEDINFILSS